MKNLNFLGRGFKTLSLSLSLMTFLSLSAQTNDECPLDITGSPEPFYSYSTDIVDINVAEAKVLNVFFWKVPDQNGNFGGQTFNRDKLLESVALLNIHYNDFNVYFKYRGFDEIPSTPANLPREDYELAIDTNGDGILDTYDCVDKLGYDPNGYGIVGRCQYTEFFNWVEAQGYKQNDAINIYVPYGSEFSGAACGIPCDKIILKIDKLNAPTTNVHEMGHALGLRHTRSSIENVTREEFLDPPNNTIPNLDFNAKTKGDLVVDTAANPGFFKDGGYPYINGNCEYISGTEMDSVNEFYIPTPDDVANAMTDAYNCVQPILSNGQKHRIREHITNSPIISPSITTISSLYEPYTGGYYLGTPVQEGPPLFQPGFQYRFIECDCVYGPGDPNPTDYGDTDFTYNSFNIVSSYSETETNYASITHPNHSAIDIVGNPAAIFSQPWRCYDFVNGTPIGGKVTRFNDNVFNANITLTPKDSTGINNPNLIHNLPQGLYAIDKNFEDGSTEQTVIQKGNN